MAVEGPFGSSIKAKPTNTTGIGPLKAHKAPKVSAPTVKSASFHAPHFSQPTQAETRIKAPSSTTLHLPSVKMPTGGSKGSGGGIGGFLGTVEKDTTGFISHLGSDAVNMAMGVPVGITYMIQHPIAGAEGAMKATWADWSPLFEGHPDVFLHNFYQHPLAPILDVLGLATGGAAVAARTAGAIGKVGELTAGVDAADAAATAGAVARGSGGASMVEATKYAKAAEAGAKGAQTTEWWHKFQKFADPAKFAEKTHQMTAVRLGYTGADVTAFARDALNNDPFARRLFKQADTGITRVKVVNRNPLIRLRENVTRNLGEKAAQSSAGRRLSLDRVVGENATFSRLDRADRGIRKAAVKNLVLREMGGVKKIGEAQSTMTATQYFGLIKNTMRDGLVAQADVVQPMADLEAQAKAIIASGKQFIVEHPDEQKILDHLDKHGHDGLQAVLSGSHGRGGMWATAHTTNDIKDALKGADGNLRVVSSTTAKNMGQEAKDSSRVAQLLYQNPTRIWRYAMLGLSPRYFVNNYVGNSIMLMAATNPVAFAGAMIDHIRMIHGVNVAEKSADEIVKTKMLGLDPGASPAAIKAAQDASRGSTVGRIHIHESNTTDRTSIPALYDAASNELHVATGNTAHAFLQRVADKGNPIGKLPDNIHLAQIVKGKWKLYNKEANPDMIRTLQAYRNLPVYQYGEEVAGKAANRVTPGEIKAAQAEARAGREVQGLHYMDKYYASEHGMSRSVQNDASGVEKVMNRFSLHGFVHKHADMPQRYMAINYTMKRMPEFQAEYGRLVKGGMGRFQAEQKAGELASQSFAVRQLVREQVNNMLGQYHTFTKTERGIRTFVPFYAWDRAIARHMQMLITQQPYKVAMAAAIGSQGNKKTLDLLGQTPDFLKSMIPGSMLGGIPGSDIGRVGALNASSLSPYGSIASLYDTAASLVGGQSASAGATSDNIGGQLNPIFQGFISGMNSSPTDPSETFGPIGGPVGSIGAQLTNLPQLNLAKAAFGDNTPNVSKTGSPALYEHNVQAALTSFLGVPIRQISKSKAATDAGVKKKHPFGLDNPPGL